MEPEVPNSPAAAAARTMCLWTLQGAPVAALASVLA